MRHFKIFARLALILGLGTLVFLVLRDRLVGVTLESIQIAVQATSPVCLTFSALAVCVSFFAITFYDRLSLQMVGKDLSWRRSAYSSTTSYSVARVLGASLLSGNLVRLWWFSKWSLGIKDVISVVLVTLIFTNLAMVLWLGVCAIQPGARGVLSQSLPKVQNLGPIVFAGFLMLILIAAGGLWAWRHRSVPVLRLTRHQFKTGFYFLVATLVDYGASSLVLFVLLWPLGLISFPVFFVVFTVASLLGAASNIPAGLGVLESALLLILPNAFAAEIISACLIYRLFYDGIPFTLSALLIGFKVQYSSITHLEN